PAVVSTSSCPPAVPIRGPCTRWVRHPAMPHKTGGTSVKADPAVQRRLLDLAETDAELNRIDHRRRTLPELAEIAEGEKSLRQKRDALVAAETVLGDLNREAKRQEEEIEAVRAREDRDRKLLKGGDVGNRALV